MKGKPAFMSFMGVRKANAWSIFIAFELFATLSAVNIIAFHGFNERNWARSRSEADQFCDVLLTSLRARHDFASAINAAQGPRRTLLALGLYDEAGSLLYRWGDAPAAYRQSAFTDGEVSQDQTRRYFENEDHDSLEVLVQPNETQMMYVEIQQSWFWRSLRSLVVLCIVAECLVATLVGSAWFMVRKAVT